MKQKTVVRRFDSIGEMRAALEHCPARESHSESGKFHVTTFADAKRDLLRGNLRIIPKAEALMDKLAYDAIELEAPVWEQSVVGFMPCVPAYLAGQPECMYRLAEEKTERSLIRIYASCAVSSGVTQAQIEERGIAILALCQKLQAARPIELYVFAEIGGTGYGVFHPVKVETSPLDLATATYALSSPAFLRQIMFTLAFTDAPHWCGQWAWTGSPTAPENTRRTREALGCEDNDLYIPGGYIGDALIGKPVEWVNAQMKRYTTSLE